MEKVIYKGYVLSAFTILFFHCMMSFFSIFLSNVTISLSLFLSLATFQLSKNTLITYKCHFVYGNLFQDSNNFNYPAVGKAKLFKLTSEKDNLKMDTG